MDDKNLEKAVGGDFAFAPPCTPGKDDGCNNYEMRDDAKKMPVNPPKTCSTCKHSLGGGGCELNGDKFVKP